MRNRKTVYTLVALVALGGVSVVQNRRLADHRRQRLPEAGTAYSAKMPPALAFVMAGLGGFRGIVSEILWFRVERLQEEGRFLELVQLADWITLLDPHASEGWTYNAWNLSYNISVMMSRHEDRWRWVQNGISLLRDEGLRFNPHDAKLYRELAWLFQHKIGDSLDNAHFLYKVRLLEAIAPCLHPDGTLDTAAAETAVRLAALRMDADRMLDVEKRFGPVDWRMPETHALYWADQGVAYAQGTELMMSRRAVYQPLMLGVFRGRFTGSLEERKWDESPNLALALPTADYMLAALHENPTRNQTAITLRFLAVTVRLLAQAGQGDAAQQLYQRLPEIVPATHPAPTYEDVLNGWIP
ncbi:MAG: hypothetical protein FWH21_08940 [Kiritimatiellaeota bacterium]|nr:hypothetical protein [Kiritimatiellota bacterium]